MRKVDHSISMLKANLYSLPLVIVLIVLLTGPFLLIWDKQQLLSSFPIIYLNLEIFIPILILGAVLHEMLHALSFLILGRVSVENVKLGFQWRSLTPYAHCKIPVKASMYRISLLMPALVMGIIPWFIALITGNGWLLVYAVIFTIVSGGDILTIWIIRKAKKDQLVQDHPHNCGCWVFE
ncbi:MAG: DUF3267 domain-containing protein [Candidatus Cloacimonetes bacterium]|nr:DUF3267 domain-containing protein [Candidatus Cloacimonadota bacterium]MBL7149237.1 DUF3267 domain-containing protein [Candidatus Cloacimonadota bacterium]